MTNGEPLLHVRRPTAFYQRRGFQRWVAPLAVVVLVGLAVLTPNNALLLGVEHLMVAEGNVGSKKVLFNDPQIQDRLLRQHIQVRVTEKGSRAGVTSSLKGVDFVFPSGQPAKDLIKGHDGAREHPPLFTSPIAFATYREYVPALTKAGVLSEMPLARDSESPIPRDDGPPIFYRLNLYRFVEVMREETRWSELDPTLKRDNQILAQTSDLCDANHAATYLGMVAYAENSEPDTDGNPRGRPVTDPAQATAVAERVRPIFRQRGMAAEAPQDLYFVDEGRQWPIVVLYEHQFLSHQVEARERSGDLDRDRVLLYPDPGFMTQPIMVSLTENGHKLGDVLDSDMVIHRRALELGFRVVTDGGLFGSKELQRYLADKGVPMPALAENATTVELPDGALLEIMIDEVLRGIRTCPKPPQ